MVNRTLLVSRLAPLLVAGLTPVACSTPIPDLVGFQCETGGGCLDGFVCSPLTNQCVVPVNVACDGSGFCPETVTTDSPCPVEGSYLPCDSDAEACELGCRTCQGDGRWGECSEPTCTVGVLENCSACGDDCNDVIGGATPVCDTTGTSPQCGYSGMCDPGFFDVDGNPGNGCECAKVSDDEVCNGLDDNCDGIIDNDAPGCVPHYFDGDRDLFGIPSSFLCLCQPFGDYTTTSDADCDDTDGTTYPGAPELCDGNINNCGGLLPDDEVDADFDNFVECTDWVDTQGDDPGILGGGDCAPTDIDINPAENELCDMGNVDENCDGRVNEQDPNVVGGMLFYVDSDMDGFGDDQDAGVFGCFAPSGRVGNNLDCDDGESKYSPAEAEVCDAMDIDENCSGEAEEENAMGCSTFFRDGDDDSFGLNGDSRCLCQASDPYTATVDGDCDDIDPTTNSGSTEVCDGNDNDCAGGVPSDEIDSDGDGYVLCGPWADTQADNPSVVGGGDCDETAALWSPSSSLRRLEVSATDAVSSGHSVAFTFDHEALVSTGLSRPDGGDIRILESDGTQPWDEIDRVLDPESSWNSATTTVWFAIPRPIGAGNSDDGLALMYGSPASPAPMQDEAQVFHYADFFDRPDNASVGAGWNIFAGTATDQGIVGGALTISASADETLRPNVSHDFGNIQTMVWRFGFDWTRSGTDNDYQVIMQIGDEGNTTDTPGTIADARAGVGPFLQWGNDGGSQERFGYDDGTGFQDLGAVSGPHVVEVTADVGTDTFDVAIRTAAGAPVLSSAGLDFAEARGDISQVRFLTNSVADSGFAGRAFDFVLVRESVPTEPTVTAVRDTGSCVERGAIVRYPINEASSGQANAPLDLMPAPLHMELDVTGADPVYIVTGGNRGLRIATSGTEAEAHTISTLGGTKADTRLDGSDTATFEIVADVSAGTADPSPIAYIGDNAELGDFSLNIDDMGVLSAYFRDDVLLGTWQLVSSGRIVLHLVLDTTRGQPVDRAQLFIDGNLQTRTDALTGPGQDAIQIGNDRIVIGNRETGTQSFQGDVHYLGVYDRPMGAGEILNRAADLLSDDD